MRLTNHFTRVWNSPTITTWIKLSVNLASIAVILPFALRSFTTEEIAVYLLFSTITGFQMIFTLGFTPTFARYFAYAKGGLTIESIKELDTDTVATTSLTNWESVERIAGAGKWLYGLIALGTFLILISIGSLLVQNSIEQLDDPHTGWLSWGIVCLSLSAAAGSALYSAYLTGMGHIAFASRWHTLGGLGGLLTCVFVLLCNGNLLAVILARHTWLIASNFILLPIARNVEAGRWKKFNSRWDLSVFSMTWQSAWRSAIGLLGNNGISNGLAVFYSAVANPFQLASFLLTFRINQAIVSTSQAPFYSQLPRIHKAYVSKDTEQFESESARRITYSLWAYTLPAVVFLAFARPAIQMLQGNADLPSPDIVGTLLFAFYLERYADMLLQVYTTTNTVIWHWYTLAYGISISVLIYPLYQHFGILGIALCLMLARLLASVPYTWILMHRLLRTNLLRWHRPMIAPTILLICSIAIACLVHQ